MRMNLRHCSWVLAIAAGIGLSGGAVQAVAPRFSRTRARIIPRTKATSKVCAKAGADHAHNLDHSKKRHFKKDEDQRAYEAGYQKGHGN